jgi:thiol-disulfide isomerase/thioredoxin
MAVISVCVLFTSSTLFAQSADVDTYRKITQMKEASERIEALKKFRADYPASRYVSSSYLLTFSSFAQLGKADSALAYSAKFLSALPEASRDNAYNTIAAQLAENKIALDVAKSYINKAVASGRQNKSRSLPMFLDTQAMVYFELNKIDSALIIQKEAVAANNKNSTFLFNLAKYEEASGNKSAALTTISKSILIDRNEKAIEAFNSWLDKESADVSAREKTKENICKEAVDNYLKSDNSTKSKSVAAAFYATLKTNLPEAEKLISESLNELNDKSSIDDIVLIKTNAAILYNAKDEFKNTLTILQNIETLATAWDTDFWLLLGNAYEKSNQKEKALDAYLNAMVVGNSQKVSTAIQNVSQQLNLTAEAVTKKLDAIKLEMKDFEAGHFDKNSFGKKVVVAELFTGAECPPCVAADRAFDKLSEFYPRDAVAILEYHLHIPGPDPMTNPDAHLKYVSYGGNFGTPTVFFDGGNQLVGGGPDYITKNRFNVYKYLIEKCAKQVSNIDIQGNTELSKDIVNVSVTVSTKTKNDAVNYRVQITLVEKSINYKGSNGVDKHIFVVRDLVNGAEGITLSLANGEQTIEQSIDIAQVETGIKTYLDDPSKDASWRMKTGFQGWKARPVTIDRKNLAVVVYVQNKDTKEILQAKYFDL